MSVISRKFAACPARTAGQTWDVIVNIITNGEEKAKEDLNSISGIVASIISDETPKSNAIIVIGTGSRLRIYCLYGDDAISDEANEAALTWKLFEAEWEIHFPVEEVDLEWVTKLLKEKGSRFKTYKAGDGIKEAEFNSVPTFSQLTLNHLKL